MSVSCLIPSLRQLDDFLVASVASASFTPFVVVGLAAVLSLFFFPSTEPFAKRFLPVPPVGVAILIARGAAPLSLPRPGEDPAPSPALARRFPVQGAAAAAGVRVGHLGLG